jgi:hypothetical protein
MQLRNHPHMTCKGRPIWPPHWSWISGPEKTEPIVGEIGILENVQFSRVLTNTLFLTIGIGEGNRFIGQLKFDDERFARRILLLLQSQIGHTIKDIAEIAIV